MTDKDSATVELTVWEGLRAYQRASGVSLIETDAVRAVLTPSWYEGFNAVFVSRPSEAAAVAEAIRFADTAPVPLLVHIWPQAAHIEAWLLNHGLSFYEEEPAMIARAETVALVDAPSQLTIKDATSPDELTAWVRLLSGSNDSRLIQQIVDLRAPDATPLFTHLLGEMNGEVVACAALFQGSRAAEVQHVVTREDCRRRGIGAAMTRAAVSVAAERGAEQVVLTASPEGFEIYRKIGFRPVAIVRRFLTAPDMTRTGYAEPDAGLIEPGVRSRRQSP